MRRAPTSLVLGLLALVLLLPGPAAAQQKPPDLAAKSWILVDAQSGDRITGAAASRKLPIASTTKLMTAYLVLEAGRLDRKIKVAPYSAAAVESQLGISGGEKVTIRDLLISALLASANDSVNALAVENAGSVDRFVRRMNRQAARLGLDDTSYANPIGFDDPDNFSTAADLAKLAIVLREDPLFRKIVAKRDAKVEVDGDRRGIENRNTLLKLDKRVDGIKTGTTLGAGYVLVSSASDKGVELVGVVLGAADEASRDAESERLLDYGFSLYRKRAVVREGERVGAVPLGEGGRLPVLAAGDVRAVARADTRPEIELDVPESIEGPLAAGDPVGVAVVRNGDEILGETEVVASRALESSESVVAPGSDPAPADDDGGSPSLTVIAGLGVVILGTVLIAVSGRRPTRRR